MLIAVVGWRVALLASLPAGIAVSPRPGVYLAAALVVLAETVAACAAGVRARRPIGPVWTWCEIAGGCLLLLAMPEMVPVGSGIGSSVEVNPGLMLALGGVAGVGLATAAGPRWPQLGSAVAVSCGCYLLATLPAAPAALVPAVVGNAITYPVVAVLVGGVTGYLRRIAAGADRAGRADGAGPVACRRNPPLLQDSARILHRVTSEDAVVDRAATLRCQAPVESARIRACMAKSVGEAPGGRVTLASTVRHAVEGFADLPIALVLDLGGGTMLRADCARAVHGALHALLCNVRRHAAARSVVIHADTGPTAGEWELSVRDDGCGYDMLTTPPGFGLAVQVHHVLAECGVATEVYSEPGEGTVAVLRGRLPAAER